MLQLTHRVCPAIGHLRIDKIIARGVNFLAKEGANEKTGKWTIIKKVDKLVERVKSYSRNERERRSC